MFSANSSQVSDGKLYVEDVFSTWLYTGTGAAQTITNGIDLAGKGGLVWIKSRSAATANFLFDTSRGVNVEINSNTTDANATLANSLTAFNSNGFSISSATGIGVNAETYASWTFREAPKFFDVVTYTGDNVSGRAIPHNLGVAPGCMFIKPTNAAGSWIVYHRSTGATKYLVLQSTSQEASSATIWGGANPTATQFTIGGSGAVNQTGTTYVAYLFAHDTTSDGIIQCGSYTGTGVVGNFVNLGWEPQWVLIKDATYADDWYIYDNMRGASLTRQSWLWANMTSAELSSADSGPSFGATGFTAQSTSRVNNAGSTYIYIAIRRGPMRTPTSGTSVFSPAYGNNMSVANVDAFTSGFATDLLIRKMGAGSEGVVQDALRGIGNQLYTEQTAAEATSTSYFRTQTGIARTVATNFSGWIGWSFRRAPSFMDVVCYTGGGSTTSVYNHNLGVVPELIIIKSRSNGTNVNYWPVKMKSVLGQKALALNSTNPDPLSNATYWASADDTATQFRTRASATAYDVNATGYTYVAYLFASCPGVSKVGSYTGNGSSQTINCGFAAGARFVMIKRTDSTGDWYVWDTARGIVAGNDPHLSLNTTAAEVTTDDSIDTDSSGFVVNQVAATNINVSSATYIYLAVA